LLFIPERCKLSDSFNTGTGLLKHTLLKIPKSIWYVLLALTAFRLLYILFLPLIPQEAYYWYYARYPDFSYFDHPPMAAYSIWLGTHLFGDTFFGVKFMAVIWGLGTSLLLYLTTIEAVHYFWPERQEDAIKLGLFSIVLYNLSVFAHLYSLLIVPDSPLLFFWIWSIFLFLKIIQTGHKKYWLLIGFSLGLGMLSKYTMIALLPAFFVVLLLKKELRRYLLSPWPYLSLLIMALVFAPVIYWNYSHHWASFSFQFGERASGLKKLQSKYIGQLLASQLALLTPLLFFPFFKTVYVSLKSWKRNFGLFYFTLSGLFIIGGFVLVSLRSLVKMNWLMPGYLGLIIATAYLFFAKLQKPGRWLKTGVGFSLFLILVAHLLQIVPNIPLGEGNTWSGWQDATQQIYQLQKEKGGREECFIFANSYKSASLLKFYLPEHQDTYAQNIYGRPALQFDIWGLPDSLLGKNALYVFTDRHEYRNDLKYVRQVFDKVTLLKTFEYRFAGNIHTRTIYCYFAENYHGPD